MKPLTQTEAAYIAGFIDGEGSIAIHRQRNKNTRTGYAYRSGVRVCNTNERVMLWMRDVTGIGSVHGQQAAMRNSRRVWNWSLWSKDAADLLKRLWPLLRVKQQQASLLLLFQQRVQGCGGNLSADEWRFREQCYHESRMMNHRGKTAYAEHASGFRVPFDQLGQFEP